MCSQPVTSSLHEAPPHAPAPPAPALLASASARSSAHLPAGERGLCAFIALGCLAILLVAASLTPDPRGHGTHEQLGIGACGWLAATGRPCPTCGMTTAFARAAHADFVGSFLAQPMGLLLAMLCAVAVWVCGHAALTGSRSAVLLGRLFTGYRLIALMTLWGGSWVWTLTRT